MATLQSPADFFRVVKTVQVQLSASVASPSAMGSLVMAALQSRAGLLIMMKAGLVPPSASAMDPSMQEPVVAAALQLSAEFLTVMGAVLMPLATSLLVPSTKESLIMTALQSPVAAIRGPLVVAALPPLVLLAELVAVRFCSQRLCWIRVCGRGPRVS